MSWRRTCSVCSKSCENLVELKNHVGIKHREVEFNGEVRQHYVMEAIFAHCGSAQPPCWMDEQDEMIYELVRVFGYHTAEAYYGGYESRERSKESPTTYYEALVRACRLNDDDDD